MGYEYECEEVIKDVIKELVYFKKGKDELAKREIDEVYAKARAFDNYMVDLAKTIETFPHSYSYIENDNFANETYEFYMKSKEDFIKAYENEVGRKHELIRDVSEYDRILSDLEGE